MAVNPSSYSIGPGTSSLAGGGWMNSLKGMFGGLKDGLSGFGNWMGGPGGKGIMDLASLAFMNKAMGMQGDQLDIMKQQEGRAAKAQQYNTDANLATNLAMATPGSPEEARIQAAIDANKYG